MLVLKDSFSEEVCRLCSPIRDDHIVFSTPSGEQLVISPISMNYDAETLWVENFSIIQGILFDLKPNSQNMT